MGAVRVKCPTCKREMDWAADNEFRPFCSERCKMVDLGAWFTGGRAIPGQPQLSPDDAAQLPDQGLDDPT
jgi:endogenous inhibitor of DNA gyrase (YacG/DUF329 family)